MEDLFLNDIETDAAELRKTADHYDLAAGLRLAAMSPEAYAERLEGLSEAGKAELSLHRKAITTLPRYVQRALTEGDSRTLKAYRERRGAETKHLAVESWWAFGGKAECKARGI